MKTYRRLAGWAIILGAVLNLTRMIPVMMGRDTPVIKFPPETTDEIVEFVSGNYSGHLLSHLMALTSFILLFFGILYLFDLMKGSKILSRAILITGLIGFGLFFIAAIFDGFVMPDAVRTYLKNPDNQRLGYLVSYSHHIALTFFTIALLFIFLFISLVCVSIILGKYYPAWLGWSGGILADLTIILFLFGKLGSRWNEPLAGILVFLGYIWLLLLGVFTIQSGSLTGKKGMLPENQSNL